MARNTWGWIHYDARCRECGFEVSGKNALGLAAQHHDRTGHSIDVESIGNISYLSDADNKAAQDRKAAQ